MFSADKWYKRLFKRIIGWFKKKRRARRRTFDQMKTCYEYQFSADDDIPRKQLLDENKLKEKSLSLSKDELSPMPNEPWKEDANIMLKEGSYSRFKNVPIFISKYKLKSSIGQGSFGFVLKAERLRDGREVAIKFIYRQNINVANWLFDSELGMIPAEVFYLKSLRHVGIVQFLDYFDDGRYIYLVTELFGTSWSPGHNKELYSKRNPGIKSEGANNINAPCDLFECIEAHKNLPEITIHYIFKQLLDIVSYLSGQGIVHRDLKDENVVVDADYRIKIVDFGCAARIPWIGYGIGREEGWFEKFNGTLAFAPPEVIRGQKYRGSEAEIWTLGVLLYTMAFRQAPFQDAQSILYGQLEFPFEEERPGKPKIVIVLLTIVQSYYLVLLFRHFGFNEKIIM